MISEIFMSFLGLLFSLVGVFFVALIGLGVLIFFIIEINKKGGVAPKILVYIIGYMLLVVLSYKILLFDLNTPSKVDISPVYNLTKITGARIISNEDYKDIIRLIDESGAFSSVSFDNKNSYDFSYYYYSDYSDPHHPKYIVAEIYVDYYQNEKDAQLHTWPKKLDKEEGQLVQISDNLRVALYNSKMYRVADIFHAADWHKHTTTDILLSNIYIQVREGTPFNGTGKPSSEAIKRLCAIFEQGLAK